MLFFSHIRDSSQKRTKSSLFWGGWFTFESFRATTSLTESCEITKYRVERGFLSIRVIEPAVYAERLTT